MNVEKLVLGTVQFGLNYGINNYQGQPNQTEVDSIINAAYNNGIKTLDTSSAYGCSEHVLGIALKHTNSHFNIISKYPRSNKNVVTTFNESLQKPGQEKLYGYLIHHFDFFIEKPEIWDDMCKLKSEGRIDKIGFSLYQPEQLQYLLDNNVEFDIVQFPYNLMDRKFEPYFPLLRKRTIEIHTRSVFLQGLFFMDIDNLPDRLKPLKNDLSRIKCCAKKNSINIDVMAMNFVLANPYINGVLFGVDNLQQFESNIRSTQYSINSNVIDEIYGIDVKEKELLNPIN